ncbi:choline ABC transporter substrate-binding protein [Natronospirillum operosum]|uniref:Choline ABC transporter substrate-binding protein n=1 Tax=Natronospirillum operosum TaxID=2759953 RepID=A0A4Z0WI69_9GAMM|nr:choline ABC transporter substrate-binding protein [Natronospirillum operosum]TGG95456.1 choline ABC transporter substrate-binding protein [Natronospirillum operosum]
MRLLQPKTAGALLVACVPLGLTAQATESTCQTVRFSDPGWTDIGVTNAVAGQLLEGLGYSTHVSLLSVPIGFQSLSSNEIDVFLGNWMPAQQSFADEYADGYERLRANLEGAKFTLAVPEHVREAGVESFADLADHADEFNHRIYGIEPGAPANELIQSMIDAGDFGLEGWELIDSSEQGMLSQVNRAVRRDEFIVFLGWEPHPMNLRFELSYLSGGDDYFGPDYGGATVYTLTRNGYADECPNVTQLLNNLEFTLDMESQLMGDILNEGLEADEAAHQWLANNPDALTDWLDGVTTVDGEDGLPAVQAYLADD